MTAALLAVIAIGFDTRSTVASFIGLPIIAIVTTATVAFSMDAASAVRSILRLAPIVWTGRRSYGIYLWHEMFRAWFREVPAILAIPLIVATTLGAAELSYRIVERPFLRLKARFSRAQPQVAERAEGWLAACNFFGCGSHLLGEIRVQLECHDPLPTWDDRNRSDLPGFVALAIWQVRRI